MKGNNELIKDRFIVILHKLASGDTLHVGKKTPKYDVKWTVSYKERTKFSVYPIKRIPVKASMASLMVLVCSNGKQLLIKGLFSIWAIKITLNTRNKQ